MIDRVWTLRVSASAPPPSPETGEYGHWDWLQRTVLAKTEREAAKKFRAIVRRHKFRDATYGAFVPETLNFRETSNNPYQDVLHHFFKETPPSELSSVFRRLRVSNSGRGWSGWGSLTPPSGTFRMSYDAQGMLYTYQMPLALRTAYRGKQFILVNGDGMPSMMSRQHQRMLLQKLSSRDPVKQLIPHAFVPFSVLQRMGVRPEQVRVLATTPDRMITRRVRVRNRQTKEMETVDREVHFLGETLFTVQGTLYLCGLDRNDNPNKRMFYCCRLPAGAAPRTVAQAIKCLRPGRLPRDAKRQGEWFLVPEPKYRAKGGLQVKRKPILSADPAQQEVLLEDLSRLDNDRRGRHVPYEMVCNGAVYVRGALRDNEHDTLQLGRVWHRVVKNLAEEGWRYVSTTGARVD